MARSALAATRRAVESLSGLPLVLAVAGLLLAEAALIVGVYQVGFDFSCMSAGWPAACRVAMSTPLRVFSVAPALALLVLSRPELRRALAGTLRPALDPRGLALHAAGFAMLLAPRAFLTESAGPATLFATFALWIAGSLAAGAGVAAALAPPRRLLAVLGGIDRRLWLVPLGALAAPEIAAAAQGLWILDGLAAVTFHAVQGLLGLLGESPSVGPGRFEIGVETFRVLVARQCSGVEGFALITGFTALYLILFRDRLRLDRALWLIPVALAASWALNVARIALLILIGAHVSPDLAVNGFHSHAGWLMFTILALTLVTVAHRLPWLSAAPAVAAPSAVRAPPPLAQDWNAAQILPFTIFMASSLVASTFVEEPALWYPLRLAAMAAALWVFRALYLRLDWRLDPVAVAAGAAVGVGWLATAAPSVADAALDARIADLSGLAFAGWALARVIGTTLVVPLIEELFFRGYILRRLDTGGVAMRLAAVAASVAPFALLHDRWAAAGLAGLVFAALALRRGRLADAVAAHAVANGLIAAWALATGGWSAI